MSLPADLRSRAEREIEDCPRARTAPLIRDLLAEVDALTRQREEMEQVPDATGAGRLLLNSYGRRCYDAGRVQAESASNAKLAEATQAREAAEAAAARMHSAMVGLDTQAAGLLALEQEMRKYLEDYSNRSVVLLGLQSWADRLAALRAGATSTVAIDTTGKDYMGADVSEILKALRGAP